MKKIFNELYLNKSLMKEYPNSEVFSSIYCTSVNEYTNSGMVKYNSLIKGTSLRIFDEKNHTGKIILQNGNVISDFQKNKTQIVDIPFSYLPRKKIPSNVIELPDLVKENNEDIFLTLKKVALEHGIILEKMSFNQFVSVYKLANSYGVEGYGYKLLNCANISITDKKNTFKEYSKIFTDNSFGDTVTKMFSDISTEYNDTEIDVSVEELLISCQAVSEVIYLLLLFLNEQSPIADNCFMSNNVMKIKDVFDLSPLITIIEHSIDNKISGGNIDGEGSMINPVYIVKNGKIERLLSCFSRKADINNTASSYRIEYRSLPQCKPINISVLKGKRKVSEIINEKETIAFINTFQGMYESINPVTLEFSSVARLKIYKYGRHIGNKTITIKTDLLKLLSSITEIANDTEYIGDGSILVPAMVCNLEKL